MPSGIATNIFLRIFIDDDGPQHHQAVALVRREGQVFVGTVVLVEALWALRSLFAFTKAQLIQFVNTVLEADTFILESRDVVEAALFAFASGSAGFADYIILESARRKGSDLVFTFDRDLAKAEGARLLKPS